ADFNEYRRSLGIAVASTPGSQGGRQVSGQISAPKEENPVPFKEPPKDELRLSRADDAKRGAKAAGTAAADDLVAKDNALKEAQERIALLERNLQDVQKLAQIKSQTGAQLQQQAEAAPATIEASFVDELLDDPYQLGGTGVAAILLVGYAAYRWRRKRNSQFENSIMSVVPSDADSVLGSAGGRNVDTSSSSLQSDFSQGGVAKADTEEIDPIAEADVYMAYGRDAQAEEILRDALAKDSRISSAWASRP